MGAAGRVRPVLLSLGFAAGLLAVLVLGSGLTLSGLWAALGRVPLWVYLPVALVQAVIIALAAKKWVLILGAGGGQSLPLRDATSATTLGALAGQVLPIQLVTPALRAWVARRHGIAPTRAVGTSLLEQVFEVIVLAAMGASGLLARLAGFDIVATGIFALLIALVLTGVVRPGLTLGAWAVARLAPMAGAFATLAQGFDKAREMPGRLLVTLTSLSLARYLMMAAMNVGLLMVLAPQADPVLLVAAYPLVLLVMTLPIFPGGLGVVELTWSGVLIAQGSGVAEATEAALALRIVQTAGFLAIAPLLVALGKRHV
ncbi:lysylphosphatidylglycerol synthase transmembrane domain-containing protein [Mesobacterium pallidum]|uniref:lysylphosphatidylglycerol synthase transmembrane domain-containing protein n=1 Tax=Mesobacterium pallidum TaxID=2872037 RepID=UPI001EE26879|nr:lysylphosphatidylglycerol synthase transmembrane domain-containing protein [Mesobacterium pallidum]